MTVDSGRRPLLAMSYLAAASSLASYGDSGLAPEQPPSSEYESVGQYLGHGGTSRKLGIFSSTEIRRAPLRTAVVLWVSAGSAPADPRRQIEPGRSAMTS